MEHLPSRSTSSSSTRFCFFLLLSSAALLSYCYLTNHSAAAILALLLSALLLIVAARATMVTWITVLVLLAFSGMRRKALVHHGKEITADVAMYLAKVLLTDKGLVAVACASLLSFFAMIHSHQLTTS